METNLNLIRFECDKKKLELFFKNIILFCFNKKNF